MGNRSLDEFLPNEPTDTDTEHDDTSTSATSTTPAAPTMVWTPDGAACERCGETVQRRWCERADKARDETEQWLVCGACKPWE